MSVIEISSAKCKKTKKEMEWRAFKLTNRAILFADNCLVSDVEKRKKTFKFY